MNSLVATFLEELGIAPSSVDDTLHERDLMFRFTLEEHRGHRDQALLSYFRNGLLATRAMTRLLDRERSSSNEAPRILDFASGHGRTTRFLVREIPSSSIWVSDIDAEAVGFQEERFGVHGLLSTSHPDDFTCPSRFDTIFAWSFFTHLPEATFVSWLRQLYRLLDEDGLLVFTVLDESTLLPGRAMPEDGFYFEAVSENETLDTNEYGTAWVRESRLATALDAISDGEASYRRFPQGLWHLQDVYVVSNRSDFDFSGLSYRPEPRGHLDRIVLEDDGYLRFGGWAIGGDDSEEVEIRIHLGADELARVAPHARREDVSRYLGREITQPSGWDAHCHPGTEIDGRGLLKIELIGSQGGYDVLSFGPLQDLRMVRALDRMVAELESSRQRLRELERDLGDCKGRAEDLGRELDRREEAIRNMKASRFWKLRKTWFALKRYLSRS